jgi:hypothetical protein
MALAAGMWLGMMATAKEEEDLEEAEKLEDKGDGVEAREGKERETCSPCRTVGRLRRCRERSAEGLGLTLAFGTALGSLATCHPHKSGAAAAAVVAVVVVVVAAAAVEVEVAAAAVVAVIAAVVPSTSCSRGRSGWCGAPKFTSLRLIVLIWGLVSHVCPTYPPHQTILLTPIH